MARARLAGALLPTGLLAAYGFGAVLVPVPVEAPATSNVAELPTYVAVAAIVAGDGEGFVLDRDGQVIRVGDDGSLALTASVGPYSTPFGTVVSDDRTVFGGVRCTGAGCPNQVAEVTILDGDGRVETTVELIRTSGRPSTLHGLALVGRDEDTVWVNGDGRLFRVAVSGSPGVVAEAPWPGGEPCVLDGVLYNLSASGGTYGRSGTDLATTATFQLQVRVWTDGLWRRPSGDGGSYPMAYGQNAYCSPEGYEIRDSDATLARWTPGTSWQPVADGSRPTPRLTAPVTSSTHTRYVVGADGSLLDITHVGPPRRTGVTIPGFATSKMPPAVQVDQAGGSLFVCATTYPTDVGITRCAVARAGADDQQPDPPSSAGASPELLVSGGLLADDALPTGAHHYNLCSAACGNGVRPHSRDVVTWFVGRDHPLALSLNEMCYDDGIHLAGRLPPGFGAGTSYVALETATNCPGAVKQFGNQALVQSGPQPLPGWWAQFPTQATLPCDRRTQECRGMACAATSATTATDADRRGRPLAFCSGHLESQRNGPAVAVAQVEDYLHLVTDHYDRYADTALAGDFNLRMDEVDAQFHPDGYRASSVGSTFGSHSPAASAQIDMIYYDTATQAAGADAATYCDRQASDHCYLRTGRN